VSKAELRSNKTRAVTSLLSTARTMSLCTHNIAVSVEWLRRYNDCLTRNSLFSSACDYRYRDPQKAHPCVNLRLLIKLSTVIIRWGVWPVGELTESVTDTHTHLYIQLNLYSVHWTDNKIANNSCNLTLTFRLWMFVEKRTFQILSAKLLQAKSPFATCVDWQNIVRIQSSGKICFDVENGQRW